jgi:hypothetical protein
MTPKYSAQWWEKVAARPQQTATEQDERPTASSDNSETPQLKTKPRKSVCRETS